MRPAPRRGHPRSLLFAVLSAACLPCGGHGQAASSSGRRVVLDLHARKRSHGRRHREAVEARRLAGDALVTFPIGSAPQAAPIGAPQEGGVLQSAVPGTFAAPVGAGIHAVDMATQDNVQYHLHLTIGGPCGKLYNSGQTVEVLPDTGSSDLWVSGSNCTNCHEETTKLRVGLSCSANQVGQRVSFGYRDGSPPQLNALGMSLVALRLHPGTFVTGGTFVDAVHLGDLQVQNQTVILVDTMGEADTHLKVDGILGLAPTSIMSDTFVAELFRAYPYLPRQFSFHLSRYMDQPSHLLFGDADLPRFSKETDFQYSSSWHAERSNTWIASVSSIGWGGTDVFSAKASSAAGGLAALVDSGTSLIVLSGSIYDQLMPELNWRLGSCKRNEEQDIVECRCPPLNDLSKMPWFTMFIIDESGQSFPLSMSPDEYILEAADPKRPGERLCIPSFSRGQPSDAHPIILGMTFMRSFYTVFDVERMRIGFARSVESPLPAGIELHLQLQLKRGIWVMAFLMTLVSALLACYVVFDPDPKDQSAASVATRSDSRAARDVSLGEGVA